jgi:hypothetical protein
MADIQALGPHIHSPARRNALQFATAARRERQGSNPGPPAGQAGTVQPATPRYELALIVRDTNRIPQTQATFTS